MRSKAPRRAIALSLAVLLVTAGCVANAPVDDANPDGTLTTTTGEPKLDPANSNTVVDAANILMVFEPLLRFDAKTLRPIPGAATALPEVSADGLTYRLTIRDDAKYSDGTPVRARDFAFSLTRLCDPAIKGPYASMGYVVAGCADWSQLDPKKDPPEKQRAAREKLTGIGVRATGEKQLTFTLTQPAAYFSSILALWLVVPVRESDVAHGGGLWTEPATYVGNGPFVLSSWKHNERLVFTPNRYYRSPPKLKQWTKVMIAEPAVALNAYRHDEIDVFYAASGSGAGSLLREIQADPTLSQQLVRRTEPCSAWVNFNSRRPPFDDPAVRLAFAKAMDREAYVRDVLGAIGAPAQSFIPPGLPGHDPNDTAQRFDPAEARRLLASSRYTGSDALGSIVIPHTPDVVPRMRAEWLRDQWRAHLGVGVRTEEVDALAFVQLRRRTETIPQVSPGLGWCADYPDQQNWLSIIFRSDSQIATVRLTGFADPEFDRLVNEADGDRDAVHRDELYRRAQRMLSERAVAAFLNTAQSISLRKPWVRGVTDSPLDAELGSTAGVERIFIARGHPSR